MLDYAFLLKNFPEVQQMLQCGLTYEQIFRLLCKERGIDPDNFIKKLQGENK